jgi:DNA-directed RNA polymerase subunit RPC12/RpoP
MASNKNGFDILNRLQSYKLIAISAMIVGALGFTFGSYFIIFKGERGSDISLTAASLVILVSNFLSYCYIKALERFRETIQNYGCQDKAVCPKCSHKFLIKEKNAEKINGIACHEVKDVKKRIAFAIKSPFVGFLLSFLIGGLLIWLIRTYFG